MERLTGRSANGTTIYSKPSRAPVKWQNNRRDVLCKLAEYEDLEEQGLLLRLPCKLGDTVYWTRTMLPYKVIDFGINIKENRFTVYARHNCAKVCVLDFSSFGKTVFFTKEEAEAALHMQGDTHD